MEGWVADFREGGFDMRVLVACESSGTVREAFRRRGHEAWSADLLPADDGSPYHRQGDATAILGEGWDLLVAHPPCTYLTNAGVRWLYGRDGSRNEPRWRDMEDGARLFLAFWNAPVPRICVENPVMHRHAKAIVGDGFSQTVQPYQFGHREVKRTCLWLRGLPCLTPTHDLKAETMALPYRERAKVHYMSPGADRWKARSKTYQGIADAMAEQWGRPTFMEAYEAARERLAVESRKNS